MNDDTDAIARTLNKRAIEARTNTGGLDAGTIATVVADLATLFAKNNPRFDMNRFLNACLSGEGL